MQTVVQRLTRRKPKWINDQNILWECSRNRNSRNRKKDPRQKPIRVSGVIWQSSVEKFWYSLFKNILNCLYCVLHLKTCTMHGASCLTLYFDSHFLPSELFFSNNLLFLHDIFFLICPLQKNCVSSYPFMSSFSRIKAAITKKESWL